MKKEIFNEALIPSLKGKTIVITGGNSGLGYQTSLMLLKKDAHIIIASRDTKKSAEAITEMLSVYPKGSIVSYPLDLGELKSIETFSQTLHASLTSIDILINNSGVMYTPYQKTKDGLEFQNGINFIGHYILTEKLLPLLKQSKKPRIVNVSSIAHKYGKIYFNDFMFEGKNRYSPVKSYHQSKLANLMFSIGLAEKLSTQGIEVHAAHPGVAITNLMRYMKGEHKMRFMHNFIRLLAHSAYDGALPIVLAAVTEDYPKHTYFGPTSLFETKGKPGVARVSSKARNKQHIQQLFELAKGLTNISY
jgi:NAD(P)-dependent dehydrogenase (short-subunit alcohol dehydrogenase family)